jgi:hypothetical protein
MTDNTPKPRNNEIGVEFGCLITVRFRAAAGSGRGGSRDLPMKMTIELLPQLTIKSRY